MICEFKKPKSESQCITEIKEIKQLLTKSIWDYNQRVKNLMAKVSFQMSDVQHKEWFIAALLPHIRAPLMQHKIVSQMEVVELAMKLESLSIGDGGVVTMQIQSQLTNMMVQLLDIKKGK